MNIGFVPFHTTSNNDVVWINHAMTPLLQFMRRNGPKAPNSWNVCAQCEVTGTVEYHHVRPLWSVAAEAVLNLHPMSYVELFEIQRGIMLGDFNRVAKGVPGEIVHLWGAHEEIVPLCVQCHIDETVRTNAEWKQILSDRYPLLWSYRHTRHEFDALVSRWYSMVTS